MLRDTQPDFTSMNETDVREEIVRPLIAQLGYKHGTDAYVRTEFTLSYSAAFLGRKNPKRDPLLSGRADYMCGVVAAGNWVVEVKGPSEELTEAVVQQAHTYAAHPDVAAFYFLVTNGRQFRVYETGRLLRPLLEWSLADQDTHYLRIANLLGPEAIRKRARIVLADPADPLGEGLDSKLRILNGNVLYDSSDAGELSTFMHRLRGLELPVTGGNVSRDADGRIHAVVKVGSVAPLMGSLAAIGLPDEYHFYSSSRYISTDEEHPTIFQNMVDSTVSRGTPSSFVGMPSAIPFEMKFSAFTEVIGFVRSDWFEGIMRIETDLYIGQIDSMVRGILRNQFGLVAGQHRMTQAGRFRAQLASAI